MTTTYNADPHRFRLSDAYVNNTGQIPAPETYLGIDYAYPDATVVLRTDIGTVTGVMRAIEKAPQTHGKASDAGPLVPAWTIAVIMLGVVLMAIGILLNQPITWAIYRTIHGG